MSSVCFEQPTASGGMDALGVLRGLRLSAQQTLIDNRAECQRLHELIIRLRIESPPKGRAFALAVLERAIRKLADRCDVLDQDGRPTGFHDPGDEFADADQLTCLIHEFNEVKRAGDKYPLPLPNGYTLLPEANFDVFAAGRLFDGKVIV